MLNIQISAADANTLRWLLHEILDIDRRARCSDSYFRSHFMDTIKVGMSSGFYKRLTDEMDRAAKAHEEVLFAPPPKAEPVPEKPAAPVAAKPKPPDDVDAAEPVKAKPARKRLINDPR